VAYWAEKDAAVQVYDPFDPANRTNGQPRPQLAEDYDDLSVDPRSSDFFEKRLIDTNTNQPVSALAALVRAIPGTAKPADTAPEGQFLDQNGVDDPNALASDDFTGRIDGGRLELSGLLALELDPFRDVALVYAPRPFDEPDVIAKSVIDHCERMRFRFAAIDAARDGEPSSLDPRTSIQDTTYAAFYAPWLVTSESADRCARAGSAVGPRARHLCPHGRRARRVQGAGQ
jgi:hypothetical protein